MTTITLPTITEAVQAFQSGDFQKAEYYCQNISKIYPTNEYVPFIQGAIAYQRQQMPKAHEHYRHSIILNPKVFDFHLEMAKTLKAMGRLDEARASYLSAIELASDHVEAHNNLGNIYFLQGDFDSALQQYDQALELNPQYAEAHSNKGCVLKDQGQLEEAKFHLIQAISLFPDFVNAHYNLATIWHQTDHQDKASTEYQWVLKHSPNNVQAWNNLGLLHREQNQIEEALDCFRQAIFHNPAYVEAHQNLGKALLSMGRYAQGFTEYDWPRIKAEGTGGTSEKPFWDGSDIFQKTLLIRGDTHVDNVLQFVRYLTLLEDYHCEVVLSCESGMKKLLESSIPPFCKIVSVETLPNFDVQTSLMSLPHLLKTMEHSIPPPVPYGKLESSSSQMQSKGERLKVGVVWASRFPGGEAGKKSCLLQEFAHLFEVPDVEYYSLTQHLLPSEEQWLQAHESIQKVEIDPSDRYGMAAVVQQMDLLIGVDTEILHLGGTMGKRVWAMLPFAAEWRWKNHGQTCPWYPSLRLFRQSQKGHWKGMLGMIRKELRLFKNDWTMKQSRAKRKQQRG